MALIRLQNKVPNIYVDQSRDFQLFCRLYDVIFNNIKYDIDGVGRLIDTHECKSNVLQLLQTKLGFFTNKEFTDDALRVILECFPLIVKSKGSREAIEWAVYMYLKTVNIQTEIKVDVIDHAPTLEQKRLYGMLITDHSVVIGIQSSVQNISILNEVLKYIIPFGYNIYFYFFVGQSTIEEIVDTDKAELILVSDDINSGIAGSNVLHLRTLNTLHNDPQTGQRSPIYEEHWDPETMQYKANVEKQLLNTANTMETIPLTADTHLDELNILASHVVLTDEKDE